MALQQYVSIQLQHDIAAKVEAVQYDTGREFHFILSDYEIPEDVKDLRIYIVKPSGAVLYNYGKLINDEIVYVPTPQTLAEVGTCNGEVQVIRGSDTLTTFPFKIEVSKNLIDNDDFASGNEFQIFDELIKSMHVYTDDFEVAENNEKTRQSNETIRKSNESTRQSNETTRKSNEDTRISNEKERQANEEKRKNAETQRQSDFDAALKSYNDSQSKIDAGLEKVNRLGEVINDDKVSTTTTYSSTKIKEVIANSFISSATEPTTQIAGCLWLKEE